MSVAERRYNTYQKWLIALGVALYLAMMISKQIFTAEIVEIKEVFQMKDSMLSLANLFYYVVYAVMQFLLVLFINKLDLRKFLSISMGISAVLTILIGVLGKLYGNILHIFIIFIINGIVQAGVYGGLVSIFNKHLAKKYYFNGVKSISFCTGFSLALCYGIATIFTALSRWDLAFVLAGVLMGATCLVFFIGMPILTKKIHALKEEVEDEHHVPHQADYNLPKTPLKERKGMLSFIIIVSLVYFLAYILYYAFNNWVPTLLYNEGNGISKVYSPLVSIIVSFVVGGASIYGINLFMQTKHTYGLVVLVALITTVSSVALVALNTNTVSVVIFSSLFLSGAKMASLPYNSVMAYKLRDCIEPGTFSYVLNGFASIAAGVAPTLSSLVFEAFGWPMLFIALALLSLLIIALTLVISRKEKKLFS